MPGNALNAEKARIFRIVHRDNLPWVLDHGLHCRDAEVCNPAFTGIGNPDLIDRRTRREVGIAPFGTLSDYVPFYFTPHSPMLYNIHTGYHGITRRGNEEILIFATSLHRLRELGCPFVFTNRHAYLQQAEFFNDLARLDRVDWPLLNSRNFKRDPDDPDKFARYEAEALVHRHVPLDALLGVACYNRRIKEWIDGLLADRKIDLNVKILPNWYF